MLPPPPPVRAAALLAAAPRPSAWRTALRPLAFGLALAGLGALLLRSAPRPAPAWENDLVWRATLLRDRIQGLED